MGEWQFGCDICQDVCPWNRRAPVDPGGRLPAHRAYPGAAAVAGMDDEAFRARFAGTPLTRPKAQGMRRNARIALGNAGHARAGGRPSIPK